jgi:hypothetical protein
MRFLVIINDQAGRGLSGLASLFAIFGFFDSERGIGRSIPDVGTGESNFENIPPGVRPIIGVQVERVDRV